MKTDPKKMEETKLILCGTDFSENAAKAADAARRADTPIRASWTAGA